VADSAKVRHNKDFTVYYQAFFLRHALYYSNLVSSSFNLWVLSYIMGVMSANEGLRRQIDELRSACSGYLEEIAKKDHKIATLSAHIDELTLLVQQNDSISGLSRRLYNAVDNRIMSTINQRGAYRQAVAKVHPSLKVSADEGSESMLAKLQKYDDVEFFAYRKKVKVSRLRPHYRVIGKLYRTSRDVSARAARAIHRKMRRGR